MDKVKELIDYLQDQIRSDIDYEIIRLLEMSGDYQRTFESILEDVIHDNPGISDKEAEALAAMILVEER